MNKPFVVGIAGGSASGKSTFTDALAAALDGLNVVIFHMDGYFKPRECRPQAIAPITKKIYTDDNHPETADLPRLRADLAAAVQANECDVILVEGLLTLHDAVICAQLDLKLFIDCQADERIVRRLRRNMSRGMTFDEIADVYLDMVRYRHAEYVEPSRWRADLVLNGSAPSDKALGMIAGAIRAASGRGKC